MKVVLCHSYYRQRGGEDFSFEQEAELLEQRGHQVIRFTTHNRDLEPLGQLRQAAVSWWNHGAYRDLRRLLRGERPDLVHVTNTFPAMSAAIYRAAVAERVPVVQALRNYRRLCSNAQLLRDGRPCHECLGRWFAWPAVQHACYRGSRAATASVALGSLLHRLLGTDRRGISLYYTLTHAARRLFLEAGMPPDQLLVKPNFVPRPEPGGAARREGALFVGRLSPEKGIATLLDAWRRLPLDSTPTIVGGGELEPLVRRRAADDPRIRPLGPLPAGDVRRRMAEAGMLIMPSLWYETFGRTIIEGFSVATPVVASRRGAMAELVDDGRTGVLFAPGDADDLARHVAALTGDSPRLAEMGRQAAAEYEAKYTPERNYELLLNVYRRAIERHEAGPAPARRGASRRTGSASPTPGGGGECLADGPPSTAPLIRK